MVTEERSEHQYFNCLLNCVVLSVQCKVAECFYNCTFNWTNVLVVPWQDSAKAQPIYQSFFKDASQAWRSNGSRCFDASGTQVPDVQVQDYLQTEPLYRSDLGMTLGEVTGALLQPSFLERVIQADCGGFEITGSQWFPGQHS